VKTTMNIIQCNIQRDKYKSLSLFLMAIKPVQTEIIKSIGSTPIIATMQYCRKQISNQMRKSDVLCEKNYEGGWVCSAIIEGHRIHRVYYGYSKKYAISDFIKNPPK
jgi:hypothetical protein